MRQAAQSASRLRWLAAQVAEDVASMVAIANTIGERDGWDGEQYRAIQRDIAEWRVVRARYLAQAVQLENPAA